MADQDKLTSSLQESLLTLLVFSDSKHGQLTASLVDANLFEPPYSDIAGRALLYRVKYGRAPGKEHIDDLFDHVLENPEHKQSETYRRLLQGMLEQSKGLNEEYVASRVTEFVRRQQLKIGVLKATDRYLLGGDNVAEDVERILIDATKKRIDATDLGGKLSDRNRSLAFLDNREGDYFRLGIPEFDKRWICPTRQELFLFLAPKGEGKSWWLIHCGKAGLLQNIKVLHITMEMKESIVFQRYYQSLFGVAQWKGKYKQAMLELDKGGRLSGMSMKDIDTRLSLDNPEIREELTELSKRWGLRFDNLIVKQFPSGSLTVPKLVNYLDTLEAAEGFIPDMLIVDYPALMYIDPKDKRGSLGRLFVDLRGVASERNLACVAATQTSKKGAEAKVVEGTHVAEDWSEMMTADTVITRSQTKDEKPLGLARLYVEKARNAEDKFTVLISQSYKTGQFVIGSAFMSSFYWNRLEEIVGRELAPDPDEDDSE